MAMQGIGSVSVQWTLWSACCCDSMFRWSWKTHILSSSKHTVRANLSVLPANGDECCKHFALCYLLLDNLVFIESSGCHCECDFCMEASCCTWVMCSSFSFIEACCCCCRCHTTTTDILVIRQGGAEAPHAGGNASGTGGLQQPHQGRPHGQVEETDCQGMGTRKFICSVAQLHGPLHPHPPSTLVLSLCPPSALVVYLCPPSILWCLCVCLALLWCLCVHLALLWFICVHLASCVFVSAWHSCGLFVSA